MSIKQALATINQMRADRVIGRHAIGGAIGAALYTVEPAETDDIDVYIVLEPPTGQKLVSLGPIKDYLEARGCGLNSKGYFIIADWQVQFLPVDKPLLREALDAAVEKEVDGIPVRVFTLEHLAAVAFQLGRPKDKVRLVQFLGAEGFNASRFSKILDRHGLLDRWSEFKREILD
ncbi:MAG: hypothetical protein ACLQM8_24270 [Limisphaerales bacterium]